MGVTDRNHTSEFNTFKLTFFLTEFSRWYEWLLIFSTFSEVEVEELCFILDGGDKSKMEDLEKCAGRSGRG